MAQRPYQPQQKSDKDDLKINDKIRATRVRVVGDDITPGVFSLAEALQIAEKAGLDLVEIVPNSDPPVCRVIDYAKFKYEQKKRQKELKSKTQKVIIKEIRFGPNTDDHDFNFKLKHAINFLKEGAKVKAYVQFHGRAIVFKERGEQLLDSFIKGLDEYGKAEEKPKLEGKRIIVMLTPKKVGK